MTMLRGVSAISPARRLANKRLLVRAGDMHQ
jgi:hypothetical protein